jgi:hypothetical protein
MAIVSEHGVVRSVFPVKAPLASPHSLKGRGLEEELNQFWL